jgi:hypothetical protein
LEIISDDLPDGISVSLSVTGTDGNILMGNLSGSYEVATYRISGDLTIAEGDTAHLHAGTEFLFDGGVNFNIYGTLKAIGTEVDSIIFDNIGDEKWRGFTLDGVSDETEFIYVRISGSDYSYLGGGMSIYHSDPILTHVAISGNKAQFGGGISLEFSNPSLNFVTISGNVANNSGGMSLGYSNPTLTNLTISGNTAL